MPWKPSQPAIASQVTSCLVPAESALEMATLTGAQALGVGNEIGSIETGKRADLVLFDTMRPEWQTLFNPVNNLVYNADGRSVHTVIIDGRVVVDAYRKAAGGPLGKYMQFTDAPIVSTDIVHSPFSCIYDSELTMVHGRAVKVFGWYDNEWGYSCRLVDVIGKLLP